MFGSCWNCGGNHFSRYCPSKGKGSWVPQNGEGNLRSLCSIWEAAKKTRMLSGVRHVSKEEDQGPKEDRQDTEDPKVTVGGMDMDGFTVVRRKKRWGAEGRCRHATCEESCGGGGQLRTLVAKVPEGIYMIEDTGGWEEIDMAIDSGATETVVGEGMLESIETVEGEAYRKGVQYEVASGTLIPNLGEKRFVAMGEGGQLRKMKAQVCEVNKALLSVKRVVQAGNRVVFDKDGSYVEDTYTGERMPLREEGGMYMLKLWVKSFWRRVEYQDGNSES